MTSSSSAQSSPYWEWDGFSNLLLEDSFTMGIYAGDTIVRIKLDLALLPAHPVYTAPDPSDYHCYKSAILTFSGIKKYITRDVSEVMYRDAAGERDLGTMHVLFRRGETIYHIEGDWGVLEFEALLPPELRILTE